MKGGDSLYDHARPIGEIIEEIGKALKEYANFKEENADLACVKEDFRALQKHMQVLDESGLLGPGD